MEDNNTSQNMPIVCANGCGFYGNPINNNMCSKCFKEVSQKNNSASANAGGAAVATQKQTEPGLPMTHLAPAATSPAATSATSAPAPVQPPQAPIVAQIPHPEPSPSAMDITPTPSSIEPSSQVLDSPTPGERPVQANKGRCFMCRAKIPLAKQAINKCRCEYVFCDTHKALEKHDCDFDFAKMGKELLTKANPKLNDKPRGGRSFTRLD
ncbi:Rab5 GDP/GTP exchange factor [Entomortierella chlamydospora]|uniref:Rab5 GDP/GTP exchange factor n=1 Tax=Entomortierella chlamydospora TaxID=101097 RepID=A0A9P6MRU4_9FUNG|nr:Rab5 GDP/GTP exchange factor [Entomortierella chlamydospora]KAG0010443.1 Rab5 GDP/GTP exchange factor [Entomortierella chlamydospora]